MNVISLLCECFSLLLRFTTAGTDSLRRREISLMSAACVLPPVLVCAPAVGQSMWHPSSWHPHSRALALAEVVTSHCQALRTPTLLKSPLQDFLSALWGRPKQRASCSVCSSGSFCREVLQKRGTVASSPETFVFLCGWHWFCHLVS